MSHTMNIKTEIKDPAALAMACDRLGIKTETGKFKLYETTEEGIGVFFPGWDYPAVIKSDGTIAMDTYGGRWGDEKQLHELTAYYGLEKSKIEARRKGYSVYESRNDQTRKLELRIRVS